MGRRGGKVGGDGGDVDLTEEQVTKLISIYHSGATHKLIAQQMAIPLASIAGLLQRHGIPKRKRKSKAAQLKENEERLLAFILTHEHFQGTHKQFKKLIKAFSHTNDLNIVFSTTWRRAFVAKYQHQLSDKLKKMLKKSKRKQQAEEEEEEEEEPEEELLEEEQVHVDQPQEEDEQAHLDPLERQRLAQARHEVHGAVELALKAFAKAGIKDERARNLLGSMSVPGFKAPVSKSKKTASVPRASTPLQTAPQTQPTRSSPKKSPLQLRVLEREFVKNAHLNVAQSAALAEKLALTPEQVMAWFRAKRSKRVVRSRK